MAESSMSAMEYVRNVRANKGSDLPPLTPLSHVEELWGDVFPGRELYWKDWAPNVRSTITGEEIEYSANQMSDGEKAVLYLAGRVFSVEPGIIVVDEPETHLHSLLAVRLWTALERARTDLRFVYITHDLTFALSREGAQFVLASPKDGLRVIDLGGELPEDVAEVLLGSASLSFYARRVVFCEGAETGWDGKFFNAWFHGNDTVVRSVGSAEMVLRCTDALRKSGIANSLRSEGIIDRDFHPDEFIDAMPDGIGTLGVHEIESLLCLSGVVDAVANHLGKAFDEENYRTLLAESVTDLERRKIILERWKRRLEPKLEGVLSTVRTRSESLDDIVAELPTILDYTKWAFSPEQILQEEKTRVEAALPGGTLDQILRLAPGKKFLADAARTLGIGIESYIGLVVKALESSNIDGDDLQTLGCRIEAAMKSFLPVRSLGMPEVM
jgi:energy-coupling factor transporter ATP-binding protein EcfA2